MKIFPKYQYLYKKFQPSWLRREVAIAINQMGIALPGSSPGFDTGTVEGNGCMSAFFYV